MNIKQKKKMKMQMLIMLKLLGILIYILLFKVLIDYFLAAGQATRDGQQIYYLPRIDLNKYVIIDGRNFYDNPIKSDIEKYRELKK